MPLDIVSIIVGIVGIIISIILALYHTEIKSKIVQNRIAIQYYWLGINHMSIIILTIILIIRLVLKHPIFFISDYCLILCCAIIFLPKSIKILIPKNIF